MLRGYLTILLLILARIACAQPDVPSVITNARTFLSVSKKHLPAALQGKVCGVFLDHADAGYAFLVIDCDGIFIYANLRTKDPETIVKQLQPLTGRKVRVIGTTAPVRKYIHYARTMTLCLLNVASISDIRAIDVPTDKDFRSPDVDRETPLLSELSHCGKRRAKGVVIAHWQKNRVILKKPDGNTMMAQFRDGMELPDIHASIEVEGYPETDLYRIHLTGAIWKCSDKFECGSDAPIAMPLAELFKIDTRFVINAKHYGKLVTVRGALREFVTDENGQRRLLLEDSGLNIQIDCSETPRILDNLKIGSLVAATGICVIDSDFWRPSAPFPKNKNLFLVPRSPDDIVVLESPSWWTPSRLTLALVLMAFTLALILFWNITLRKLVERRSREVIRAQTSKLESELRINERTRLAAELHDNTVQNLTAIAYRITAAQGALDDRETNARQILQVAAKMLKSCRTSLRQCLWDLRNDVIDEPDFNVAVMRTVETVAGDAKLSIRFSGRRDLINDTTAHAILNILRELVSNATVHGEADSVSIAGEAHLGSINFSVRDNGIGFDPAHRPGQDDGHFGLDSILERLESLGGTLDIDSSKGCGTYVRICIQPSKTPQTNEPT